MAPVFARNRVCVPTHLPNAQNVRNFRNMLALRLFGRLDQNLPTSCQRRHDHFWALRFCRAIRKLITLAQVQAAQKSLYLFFLGGFTPQTPTSSRLLSQPPQARFERLSQVGRCRGLQGWEVLERYQARDWLGGPGPAHTFFLTQTNKN